MTTKTIDIGKFGAVLTADMEAQADAVRRGMRRAAFLSEGVIARKTPVDTANTRNAWRTVVTPSGAEVVNDSPAVLFLETGTRPHRPPLLPILQWLSRKVGQGSSIASISEADGDLVGRAMGVVEAIAKRGTPAHRMVQGSEKEMETFARAQVERELARELSR